MEAIRDDENAWVLEWDDETRGLAERTNRAYVAAEELAGLHTFSTEEEARALRARLQAVRDELAGLRSEHRRRIRMAKMALPQWRRHAVASVAIRRAETEERSLRADLGSIIGTLDGGIKELTDAIRSKALD